MEHKHVLQPNTYIYLYIILYNPKLEVDLFQTDIKNLWWKNTVIFYEPTIVSCIKYYLFWIQESQRPT